MNLDIVLEHASLAATIWINAVQPAWRDAADVFQTVSPSARPRGDLLLGRALFQRPRLGSPL